jgi:hypothetical protein
MIAPTDKSKDVCHHGSSVQTDSKEYLNACNRNDNMGEGGR